MGKKKQANVLMLIEIILEEFNELKATFKPLGYLGLLGKDQEELAKINRLITKTKTLISNRFGADSIYYKQVESHSKGRQGMCGRDELIMVMGDLEVLYNDIKQNDAEILEEEKVSSLKFDKVVEDTNITDKTYEEVITEINGTYVDHYFASMYIMVRKLLENLLYDCLKKYYKTDVEKYYNTSKDQHQGFGTLIDNFNQMINDTDFKTRVGDIEQRFIDLLKEFQEKGNIHAHSLFDLPHQDFIEERIEKINNLIKKLDWVLQKL
jgi:hypothetical protein